MAAAEHIAAASIKETEQQLTTRGWALLEGMGFITKTGSVNVRRIYELANHFGVPSRFASLLGFLRFLLFLEGRHRTLPSGQCLVAAASFGQGVAEVIQDHAVGSSINSIALFSSRTASSYLPSRYQAQPKLSR